MTQFSYTVKPSQPSKGGKKYFTLAEAQRALPLVKRIAGDIQATQALRLRIHAELGAGISDLSPKQQAGLQADFDAATERLESLIEELTQLGVDLKDPSRALLDFPCLHEGREVSLCWKADEESIGHFHEVDGGFAGRRPVSHLHE